MAKIQLYYSDRCPYCVQIFKFINEKELDIEMFNINGKPELKNELIEIGGKGQVPCLIIDNVAMYESAVIIKWLEDNYA